MFFNRIIAAIVVAVAFAASTSVWAASSDYRFELDGPPAKSGKATLIKVRLIHVPDGTPVSGAVIIQTKFDMRQTGMRGMAAPAKALPASEGGVYQIETLPSMAGNWVLTLSAKVQGEPETVRGTVIVPVAK